MGVGFDHDGHVRITKGEGYLLLGGSAGTHDRMQEQAESLRETLREMGTDLGRASLRDVIAAARRSGLGR
ncbi:MAG: hypothetical protein ACE5JG_11650 [Planctomycetota bacterium]